MKSDRNAGRPLLSAWRLLWRLPLLILHLLVGIPLTLLCFLPGIRALPAGGMALRYRAHLSWSRIMLRIFGMRMQVSGQLPSGPALIVANHISWMDIVLLHALWPMRLIAKAEIRRWPLVGQLATMAGTLFIKRGSEASRRRVNRRMAALLKRGDRVGIFPEGGINHEPGIGKFHARLFGAGIRAKVPVVPVAIRYYRGGDLHDQMVFAPGENFIMNMLRLLALPPSRAQLMIGPVLTAHDQGRNMLARASQQIVSEFYAS